LTLTKDDVLRIWMKLKSCKEKTPHNKKMELTTKAEPILGKFKDLGGFCGNSFRRCITQP